MKLPLPRIAPPKLALGLPRLRLPAALVSKLPAGLRARLDSGQDEDGDWTEPDPRDDAGEGHDETPDDRPRWKRALPWAVTGAAWGFAVVLVLGGWLYLGAQKTDIALESAARDPAAVLTAEEIAAQLAQQRAADELAAAEAARQAVLEAGEAQAAAAAQATLDPGAEQADAPDPFRELMHPHPDGALVEDSDIGPLPRVGADGRVPWRVYARPTNALETRPRIAVVIVGLGLKRETTERAISLPGAVTLAFAPRAGMLDDWIAAARDDGHEVLLGLPMEPVDFPRNDAGPEALMSALTTEQNMNRLKWLMSRATGYIGFVNTQGGAMLADTTAFRPLAEEIAARGLMFLEAGETPIPASRDLAASIGLPALASSQWIDRGLTRETIEAALADVETRARANGTAIALAHPYPLTVGRLRGWIRGLEEKGLALVPLSALLDRPPA